MSSPPPPTPTPPTLGSLFHPQRYSYGNFLPAPAQAGHAIMATDAQNAAAQSLQRHPNPAEASYAQFRQSLSNRAVPALNFQGRSIQRSPTRNSTVNNAPTALMYSPSSAQSTNIFSSPPEVPRTTANLPNINIRRFNIGPPPVVNPHAFPIQPYGNAASRQYAQHQVSYAQQPMRRAAPSAYMGLGVLQPQSPASYRPQLAMSQAPCPFFRTHEQILAEARRSAEQDHGNIEGVAGAHGRLYDAVESNIASLTPHESATPSLSPVQIPSSPPVQPLMPNGRAGSKFCPPQHSQHQALHSHYAAPAAQVQPQPDFSPPGVHTSSLTLRRVPDTIHVQQQTSSSSKNAAIHRRGPVLSSAQSIQYYALLLPQAASLGSQRQLSATGAAPTSKKVGRPRKPTNELKRPRYAPRKVTNPISSPLSDAISLASTHESDADAEGSADEDSDESNYQVANGMARKAPRESQPPKTKITLKLNMANTSDAEFEPNPEPQADSKPLPRGRPRKDQTTKRKATPKPKQARGRAATKKRASASPSKKAPTTLPPSILGKAKPTQLEDILTLINFERDAYNANPQRQADIDERNAQIKKENHSRNDKIRRAQQKIDLENTPPVATRRRQAKRKDVLDDEDGDDEVSVVGQGGGRQIVKNKVRKTKRMGNEEVAAIFVPDEDGDHAMHDDTTTAAASEIDELHHTTTPAAIDDDSDTSFSYNEVLKPRDHLPTPHGPFHPAPNSFLFDARGNATPNPKYRRSRRLQQTDPTASPPPTGTRKLRPRAQLKDLVAMPELEKVVYEPIGLPHLTKKLKEAEWAVGGSGGDAEAGKLVTDVVGGGDVSSEKNEAAVLLPDLVEAATEAIGVDRDGDVEMDENVGDGKAHESDLDAEGETD